MPRAVQQLMRGTLVGLIGGFVLGGLLGVLLATSRHSYLFVDSDTERVALLLLLAAGGALLTAALLLPFGLAVAASTRLFPKLARSVGNTRFYASLVAVGAASVIAFFWIGFVGTRDLTSLRGLGYLSLLGVAALAAVWCINGIRSSPAAQAGRTSPLGVVALTLLCSVAAFLSYRFLDAPTPPATDVSNPRLSLPPLEDTSAEPRPWRVILVSIDTLRADHLSGYGYARPTTPAIDRLAKDGVLFSNARSQAPWTLPSHASLFTSLYPSVHGVRAFNNMRFLDSGGTNRLEPWNLTLAELLQASGYRTAGIASAPWLDEPFGLDQGFETSDVDRNHTASLLVDKAIAWLDRPSPEPTFLFLHFFDVHDYSSPEPFATRFSDESYAGPLRDEVSRIGNNLYDNLSNEDLAYAVAKYDAALQYVDHELERLFDHLRRTETYDETLVVLTSDHGEEFWEHGAAGHGYGLYDEQLRVPLVIKPPAEARVRYAERDVMAGGIDVMPTILDYLGLPSPNPMQGISLRRFVETDARPPARSLISEATLTRHNRSVVRDSRKYIANRLPPTDLLDFGFLGVNLRAFYLFRSDEVFDLASDPSESTNLLHAQPEQAERLRSELIEYTRTWRTPLGPQTPRTMEVDEETLQELRSLGYIR